MGKQVINRGASVIISGLFYRKNKTLNKCTQEINKILKEKCGNIERMMFMDQEAISDEHICDDRLHLNEDGSLQLLNESTTTSKQNEEQTATQIKHKINLIVKNIENISSLPPNTTPPAVSSNPLQFIKQWCCRIDNSAAWTPFIQ